MRARQRMPGATSRWNRGKDLSWEPLRLERVAEHQAIEIGRRLGASYIIGGAYQRLGALIRITAELVDVRAASLVRTVKVDGKVDDLFTLQGASRSTRLRKLQIPAALPSIFAGLRIAAGLSVIGAIVGEYLGGSEGLGYLVVASLNALDAPRLFAVIVLLAIVGSLLYLLVTMTKRFVIPWHDSVSRTGL